MLAVAHPQTQTHTSSLTHEQARERERERERQRTQSRAKQPLYRPMAPSPPRRPPTYQQPSPKLPPHKTPPAPPLSTKSASGTVDINTIPSVDLLKLLASLLQRIASANDALRSPSSSSSQQKAFLSSDPSPLHPPLWRSLTTASREALSNSTSAMSFHARNIPQISLESYLLRILKYCPTTNQVFISLLVYFDRMTKLANDVDAVRGGSAAGSQPAFKIDSYNVHRLVIAGVTVASKFFSDVFYTNSRYAKVGGLPQTELNQLELAFLLLNDFQLVIPCEEMQRYTEQLVAYGAEMEGTSTLRPPVEPVPEPPAPVTTSPKSAHPEPEEEGCTETDDENTIRPTHSAACSETQSIYSEAPSYDSETQSIYSAIGSEPYTPASDCGFFTGTHPGISRQSSFADDERDDYYDATNNS